MPLINFEIPKLKKTITLDVSLSSTFAEISKLILNYLNVNFNDFSNDSKNHLKFVYQQKICNEKKRLKDFQIVPESKVTIFIPKCILNTILNRVSSAEEVSTAQNTQVKEENNSTSTISSIQSSQSDETKQNSKSESTQPDSDSIIIKELLLPFVTSPTNEEENNSYQQNLTDATFSAANGFIQPTSTPPMPTISYFPPSAVMFNSPLYNEEYYHSFILNSVDLSLLQKMIDLNFDQLDSAYALCYKSSVEYAINLIVNGIASDPKYRYHINMIVGRNFLNSDERLLHEIELSKFDAKMNNENEMVAIASAINRHCLTMPIIDPFYNQHLTNYINEVERLFPGAISQKMIHDQEESMKIMNEIDNSNGYRQVNNEFMEIFNEFPKMTPENFVNPYELLYDELMSTQPNEESKAIIEFGKSLDFDQLGFVYRMMVSNKAEITETIQLLKMYNGDVMATESFINENQE